MGGGLHTFSVFGFKSLFTKRWGSGFIHWFCKAMDVWCHGVFPGESYEIARRFWPPPLKSNFAKLWEATYPHGLTPKFGGGVRNLEGGCEIWKGGVQMKYHECMHLGGLSQQQFHAAPSLYVKVVLRSLNVLNAIVCSSCCWFLSIVRVPFSNMFLRIVRYRKDVFLVWALGWRWLKCADLIQPCMPIPYSSSTSVFYQTLRSTYGARCFQQSYSQGTDLAERNCRDSLFFTSPQSSLFSDWYWGQGTSRRIQDGSHRVV